MASQACPAPEPCAIHDTWIRARAALAAELASTSLRSITGGHDQSRQQEESPS
jgi:DNA-binding IscR family transcriptional regulator